MSKLRSQVKVKPEDVSSHSSNDDDDEEIEIFFAFPQSGVKNVAPGFTIQGSVPHLDCDALNASFQGFFHSSFQRSLNSSFQSYFNCSFQDSFNSSFQSSFTSSFEGARFQAPVSWHNLAYTVKGKRILRGLTGTALPSRCLAIMGSSGAGKTTFLNAISDRLAESRKMKIYGTRQIGDVEYRHRYRKAMGLVPQDDILSPMATPDSALRFSVRVRRGTNIEETNQRVEEVMQELRLVHCRDTIVGTPGLVAGLSGGERKRCNIGVELICDPKILLLDEPTSGLDSVTSTKIVHLLNELARKGRTVVYTIHQPTSETLTFFDDLMLLTNGRCAYHGTMADSVPYFRSIGFPCPDTFTPTDYFMTLLQDTATSKILTKKWESYLKSENRMPHTTAIKLHETPDDSTTTKFLKEYTEHFGSSVGTQLMELIRRNTLQVFRNRMYIIALFMQAVVFAVIMGLVFINIGNDVTSIQDRQGLLFMVAINRSMGPAFFMINNFPVEKPLFIREQQTGSYSAFVFFVAKMIVDFPLRMLACFLECLILYWMSGLTRLPGPFFYYFAVVTVLTEVASAFGFAVSALSKNVVVASGIAPMILIPMMVAGGLLASTDRLRPYWYWLEKISFMRYANVLLMRNEFKYVEDIYCDVEAKGALYCANQPKNGHEVLARLGFDDAQSQEWILWISLAVLYIVFSFIVSIALFIAGRAKY